MLPTILVVDDHSLIRMATKLLIDQQSELQCIAAVADLESAAEILKDHSIDLVVCDIQFAAGNALGFISEWSSSGEPQFLVCSAHRPEVFAPLCAKAGARGYIHKSNHCQELIDAIHQILASKRDSDFLGAAIDAPLSNRHEQLSLLTSREWEVFNEIGRGKATKEIAREMFVSAKTVESHRASIKRKLDIDSKDYLVSFAAELCLSGVG